MSAVSKYRSSDPLDCHKMEFKEIGKIATERGIKLGKISPFYLPGAFSRTFLVGATVEICNYSFLPKGTLDNFTHQVFLEVTEVDFPTIEEKEADPGYLSQIEYFFIRRLYLTNYVVKILFTSEMRYYERARYSRDL